MRKISDVISDIVQDHPFLEDALHHGYLNLTAFAEYIHPEVQKATEKEASVHAIKMALSRMDRPDRLSLYEYQFLRKEISTTPELSIITVPKTPYIMDQIAKLYPLTSGKTKGYLTILEGSREVDIIADVYFQQILIEMIPPSFRTLDITGLALCSLHLSDKEIEQSGLLYSVTKQLAFHKINIIQVISTYHEFGIIVKEPDLKRVIMVLLK